MTNDLLHKIAQPGMTNLDLLIDELNDHLERVAPSVEEVNVIVERMSEILKAGHGPEVWESVFNLLGSISERKNSNDKICEITIRYLHELPAGCLVHAIPIIVESDRLDKKELLSDFLSSTNVAVRNMASKYIQEI